MARATRRRQESASRQRSHPAPPSAPRPRAAPDRPQLSWPGLLALLAIFVLAFGLRAAFVFEPATEDGFRLTGGSDPYYHKRVVDYVQENGEHLQRDELLNYPYGANNNRPPLFDWSIAITGLALSPFFDDAEESTWWAMEILPAIYGALIVFPVYAIGRAQFGRPAGLMAALFIAINAGHISHSTLALADHDSYIAFFATTAFFFFMRALTVLRDERWVASWRDWESVRTGLRDFVRHERLALGYAGLAGMTLTLVALSWKGFPYLMVIIYGYLILQMLVNMFRRVDSTSVAAVGLVALALPVLLSLPYYQTMGFTDPWWNAPAYIFLAALGAALLLVITRDLPWLLVLVVSITVAGLVFITLKYIFIDLGILIFSGQGYFVRTKLFDTIAEAQPPTFSHFVFSFGWVTAWLAIGGLIWMGVVLFRRHGWQKDYLFILMWSLIAIYMAQSAVRFIFNATPVFALLAGWITWLLIEAADFPGMWAQLRLYWSPAGLALLVLLLATLIVGFLLLFVNPLYALLALMVALLILLTLSQVEEQSGHHTYRDRLGGLRRGIGLKQLSISFAVVFLLVLPNLFHGLDAAVPFEEKKERDVAIYDALYFDLLRPDEYRYDQRGNTTLYPEGVTGMYNLTDQGQLWYLSTTTGPSFPPDYWREGLEWLATQDTNLPPEDRPGFISWWDYGFWAIDIGEHPTVADNFQYGYQLAGNFITAQSEQEALALLLYRLIEPEVDRQSNRFDPQVRETLRETNDSAGYTDEQIAELERIIRYPAKYVPKQADGSDEEVHKRNAAIRAARPILMNLTTAELADMLWEIEQVTGHSIRYFGADTRLMPYSASNTGILYAPVTLADYDITDFVEMVAVLPSGEEISMEEAAERAAADPQFRIQDQKLNYKQRFVNTMFYRAFIGWSGPDIGRDLWEGIPGIAGPLGQEQGLPPLPGWNLTHFRLVQVNSGLRILKYYDGATITGVVRTPGGAPVANANLTVIDEYRTPHATATTDAQGRYSLLAPAGNLSLVVSMGPWESEQEKLFKTSNNILAQDIEVPVSEAQATRRTNPVIQRDIIVDPASLQGQLYWDRNENQLFSTGDDPVAGVTVTATYYRSGATHTTVTDDDGNYELTGLAPGEYTVHADYRGHNLELASYLGDSALRVGQTVELEGALTPAQVRGYVAFDVGFASRPATLTLTDQTNGTQLSFDGTGQYLFDDLLPGNYSLRLDEADLVGEWDNNTREFTLDQGETRYFNQTLRPGFHLTGTLTSHGQPVAGTQIDISDLQGFFNTQLTTSADGYFATVLPHGTFNLYSLQQEGSATSVFLARIDSDTFSGPLVAEMEPGNRVVGSLFRDLDGNGRFDEFNEKPVTDLAVTFDSPRGATSVFAGGFGLYEVTLPAGDYTAYASGTESGGESRVAVVQRVQVEYGSRVADLPLVAAHDLFGVVSEDFLAQELPLEATLILTSAAGTLSAWSGPMGYSLTLPPATYTLDVSRAGYRLPATQKVELYGSQEAALTVVREPTTLTGRVLYQDQPLAGAQLRFIPDEFPEYDQLDFTTDAQGRFTALLPPTDYHYTIVRERQGVLHQADGTLSLAIGQATHALGDIATNRQVELRGFAYGDSVSQAGTVVLRDVTNTSQVTELEATRPDGFRGWVRPGTYYLTFDDHVTYRYWGYLTTLTINGPLEQDLVLSRDHRVHGILRSKPTEQGIHEALAVQFASVDGVAVIPSNGDDGDYGIFDLPAGSYDVTVELAGYQRFFAPGVEVNGPTAFDIELVPDPVELTLNLTYTNASGDTVPLAGVAFTLTHSGYQQTFVTDDRGQYNFSAMVPALYELEIDAYLDQGREHYQLSEALNLRAGHGHQFFTYDLVQMLRLRGVAYYDRDFNDRVDPGEALPGAVVEIWGRDGDTLLTDTTADAAGGYEFYLERDSYLLWVHAQQNDLSYVWLDTLTLDQARDFDPSLARGVAYNVSYLSAATGDPVEFPSVELDGERFNLILHPAGNLLAAVLPPGAYTFRDELRQLEGSPDYIYVLDHDAELALPDDGKPTTLALERHLWRGLEVTVDRERAFAPLEHAANFTFNLTGTGFQTTDFRVTVSESPLNWTTSLDRGSVVLEFNQTAEVVLRITPDSQVIPGVFTFYTVTFSWSGAESGADEITHTFELQVTPTRPPDPDFVLKELTWEPYRIEAGTTVTLRATVANTVPGSGDHAVPVAFYVGDASLALETATFSGEGEVVVETTWTAEAGSHTFRAVVDAGEVFDEQDEENNQASQTLTISAPLEDDEGIPWWLLVAIAATLVGMVYFAVRLRR